MKKALFAFEVFSIIALFILYLVFEINHEPNKPPTTDFHPVARVERIKAIPPEAKSINGRSIIPLPVKILVGFLKFPM